MITVQNLTKSFKFYSDRPKTLKDFGVRLLSKQLNTQQFVALNKISFEIAPGEAVAIVGRNGSGKSTLLKLLTGILKPNTGTLSIQGRISPLLELGAGFHPDFTGLENITLNASILGMTTTQIQTQLDSIIAFSEIETFINQPVRTYSSGMYMRLAFSIAVHASPEILLIDEVLAVGDHAFQQKCLAKIQELHAQGVTLVLISHDHHAIERVCSRAIWLDKGQILADGPVRSVIEQYLQS
jgi:ABC-type polysaccharide/polyol phosphate transport system ATPase subunit